MKFVEIELPPPEMWDELDNSGKGNAEPEKVAEKADAIPTDPIEELDFVGDAHLKIVHLAHPFRWKGDIKTEIIVQRLRIGDVDRFIRRAGLGSFSTFEVYAEMTGFPASVLRGLVDEDGDAVTDACYDFLPPSLRPVPASSES
ncbi:hypothetical protein [Agrobacterium sp. MS2]|uniref:hypothetical protein n=1 Tax=Agrobacterium sp. MS2 TaxID=1345498 RepID=UPI0011B93692|nr:hypothetical protein [Agrobacterium sp. MS2]